MSGKSAGTNLKNTLKPINFPLTIIENGEFSNKINACYFRTHSQSAGKAHPSQTSVHV